MGLHLCPQSDLDPPNQGSQACPSNQPLTAKGTQQQLWSVCRSTSRNQMHHCARRAPGWGGEISRLKAELDVQEISTKYHEWSHPADLQSVTDCGEPPRTVAYCVFCGHLLLRWVCWTVIHSQLIEVEWRIYESLNKVVIGSDNSLKPVWNQALI